jgi:hypothetical protein
MSTIATENPDPITRKDMLKQRRLLLGFTFALTAIHGLPVILMKDQIEYQGTALWFGNGYLLVVAIWIAWGWSWWRYVQYYNAFDDKARTADFQTLCDYGAEALLTKVMQEKIANGAFQQVPIGIEPNEKLISVGVKNTGAVLKDLNDRIRQVVPVSVNVKDSVWQFPNLALVTRRSGEDRLRINGTSIELDSKEVAGIKKAATRELALRYPHFLDWKGPFYLLWLAPAALILDAIRNFDDIERLFRTWTS